LLQLAAGLLNGALLLLDLRQRPLQMRLTVPLLGALMPDRQQEVRPEGQPRDAELAPAAVDLQLVSTRRSAVVSSSLSSSASVWPTTASRSNNWARPVLANT
jgi:hypothetical protein